MAPSPLTQSITLSNGVKMPVIGLGTWQATDEDLLTIAVRHAITEVGYRHIDTASCYGNEHVIGATLKEIGIPREEVFITSKLFVNEIKDKALAIESCENSMKRLGTDYLDLYLIHWPYAHEDKEISKQRVLDAWKGLETLYKDGKVRAIGVSNFTIEHLEWFLPAVEIKPVLNQFEQNIYLTQKELSAYLKEKNIAATSYRSLGGGVCLSDETLIRIAKKHNKEPAHVALRYILDQGHIVIPKSVTPSRVASNADIFDFKLDEEDMKALDGLNRDLHYCPNPYDWEDLHRAFKNVYVQ